MGSQRVGHWTHTSKWHLTYFLNTDHVHAAFQVLCLMLWKTQRKNPHPQSKMTACVLLMNNAQRQHELCRCQKGLDSGLQVNYLLSELLFSLGFLMYNLEKITFTYDRIARVNDNSSVQSLSHVQLFATPWLQNTRPPCPSPTPRACSNSCP